MKSFSRVLLAMSSLALLSSCQAGISASSSESSVASTGDASSSIASQDSISSEDSASSSSHGKKSSSDSSKEGSSAGDNSVSSASSVSSNSHSESSKTSNSSSSAESVSSVESASSASSASSVESVSSASSASSSASTSRTSSSSSQSSEEDDGDFSITTSDGAYSKSGSVYTITSHGSYTLSGTLVGQIYVDVEETEDGESEVELDLNGVDISYGENSPIYILSADAVKIKAHKNSTNVITDLRELESSEDDTQGGGAIYSKVDLKFTGTGSLTVVGTYNNGIHTTKDLKIKNQTLHVTAPNNAIKGNDSITIEENPTVTAISTGGDALKTSNTDTSSSGKQRGTVTISGGMVNLYAACDAIDAAYDAIIEDGEDDEGNTYSPVVNMYTNKYSSYTGEIVSASTETLYLRTTTAYSSSYRYAVLFYDTSISEGVWADATYLKSQSSGGRPGSSSTYYYYTVDRPTSYASFQIYRFNFSSSNSTSSYVARSSGGTINSERDMITFSISGTSISTQWGTYSQSSSQGGGSNWGPGWGEEGNTDKADASAKGIKAENTIQISGGTIYIKAYDDAIHANYGTTFDNDESSTGVGDVLISGGSLTIYASDDGIRADRYLRISDGTITVEHSYEALEGNQIYISGGDIDAYATNDGMNAGDKADSFAGLTAYIEVSGGYLQVAVPLTGDTDGIDSNGSYKQTGGTVIACGPASQNAAAMDTDGTVTVNGGTLLLFGTSEQTPYPGSGVTSSTKSGTYSNKIYNVTYSNGTTITTKKLPSYSYSGARSWSVNGSISSIS